ncbi:LOW QUALITY PROTEIN: uncharacterized protein LOC132467494 [Gadus macrocephalus]|uniref:LOW QUALITY PROTEIN: uncharacterized protein LOC132467494 n=1 Tax=Gadus macrocephalus TaxID=80720 RepID=UPI0028CB19A8|nr:LOW QUALITY PROTEIN: uncharacterized protein LOC132467494 [Gadus macrocephalus]
MNRTPVISGNKTTPLCVGVLFALSAFYIFRHNYIVVYRVGCHGNVQFFNDHADLQLPESYRVPWMKAVEDSSRLSALSIPGSHDSLSLDGGSLARHQAWPLDLQLRAGIPAAVWVSSGMPTMREVRGKVVLVQKSGEGSGDQRVNHFLSQYTPNHPRPCFGVVAMDFPGFNLIQTIINLNWRDIMSVSMTKSEGVTVMTMTSDPGSACPPLCQILKALCYSPVCCNVSQKLRSVLGTSHSALGAMQVMVGLINIGLGGVLSTSGPSYLLWELVYFPFWMGSLFIVFGFLCILSEKFPSLCLVVSSVTAQLSGVGLSITAVVLYSINLALMSMSWLCEDYHYDYYRRESTGTPIDNSSDMEKCLEGLSIIKAILRGVNGLLIILSVLQLCLSISCVVLGIKAIKKGFKKEKKSEDIEHYTPLLTEKPAY